MLELSTMEIRVGTRVRKWKEVSARRKEGVRM